jgi:hypothetical protein
MQQREAEKDKEEHLDLQYMTEGMGGDKAVEVSRCCIVDANQPMFAATAGC